LDISVHAAAKDATIHTITIAHHLLITADLLINKVYHPSITQNNLLARTLSMVCVVAH
jgi:hypothetical protein